MSRGRPTLLLGVALAVATDAHAKPEPTITLTLDQATKLALRQGPRQLAARARIAEARSAETAARVWRFNPELQLEAGPRLGADRDTTLDWSIGAGQRLELGKRGDRVDAARAEVDTARARGAETRRRLTRAVGLAFVELLYWQRRATLAADSRRIAETIARVARQRRKLGDLSDLEAGVAALSLSRALAAVARDEADRDQARARLGALLGLRPGSSLVARGQLRQLSQAASPAATSPALDQRADLRALAAAKRAAGAEATAARAGRYPDLALGASYAREESAHIIKGGLTLTLPLFDHGQGAEARARGRQRRLEVELRAARRQAATEVVAASAALRQLAAAARAFEREGLPVLERTERMTTASYKAGAIPLDRLLVHRRELVDARHDYVALLRAAARAKIELTASEGRR